MALTREQVRHVASLARLRLSPEEEERAAAELSGILAHVDALAALDVSQVPPTTHAVEVASTPLRADEPHAPLGAEAALAAAPAKAEGHFLVPRILE